MKLLPQILLLSIPAAVLAQHTYTPADIQKGGRLFRVNCVLYHGPDGDQASGIDLGLGKQCVAISADSSLYVFGLRE